MKKKNMEIVGKIKVITDAIALSNKLDLEQYCELLKKSKVLNKLVDELVQLNMRIVKSCELEAITNDYLVNMLVSAYCINNSIGNEDDELYELEELDEIEENNVLEKRELTKREKEREEMADIMALRDPNLWYIRYLKTCPKPITDLEEQKEIFRKIYAGDEEAKKYFTDANLRLVYSIAKKYMRNEYISMKLMDLVQEGNFGLFKAIDTFDINKNCKFSTHARWWIRQAITRAIDDKERCIRVPVHVCDADRKIKKVIGNFTKEYNRMPSVLEISEETGLSSRRVQYVLEHITDMVSLNDTISCDGKDSYDESKMDYLEDAKVCIESDILEDVWQDDLKNAMNNLVNSGLLNEKERIVIIKRFGLDGSTDCSLRSVAKELGITYEAVRLRENRALRKLRMNPDVRKIARGVVLN